MRKFWIVLLSLALVMAFTMPVFAADGKFSGEYKAQGVYDDNRKLADTQDVNKTSLSNIFQRLRLQSTFVVAEGLSLTTRFDAMERVWSTARSTQANTQVVEGENISFEQVYVTFNTAIGKFDVGYQTQTVFGLDFMNSGDATSGGRIKYTLVTGPMTWLAIWDKQGTDTSGKSYNSAGPAGGTSGGATANAQTDADYEGYAIAGMYNWDKGSAGLLLKYVLDSRSSGTTTNPDTGSKAKWYLADPYIKATFGPVYFEAELMYRWGQTTKFEQGNDTSRIDRDLAGSLSAYVMANVNLAPAYVGALAFYVSGDDPGTYDKDEAGYPSGADFSPCLILMNYDMGRFNGSVGNANGIAVANSTTNILAGQVFAGVKPVPKLDVKLSVTSAKLDKETSATQTLVSKNLGYEADLTATYKIYDNLQYMIGFGYLWAGDAFKGYSDTNKIANDYLVTHKLSLTF